MGKIKRVIFLVVILFLLNACEEGFDKERYLASQDTFSSLDDDREPFDSSLSSNGRGEEQIPTRRSRNDRRPTPVETPPSRLARLDMNMVAIGDSITVGFNATGFGESGRRYSWSTGQSLAGSTGSHLNRIKSLARQVGRDLNISAINLADVGAEAIDTQETPIGHQALQAMQHAPEYVTMMIGDNDVCNTNLSLSSFRSAFKNRIEEALATLTSGSRTPQIVLVTSIPNPRSIKATQPSGFSFDGLKCRASWELLCSNMQRMAADRFDAYWRAANEALEQASQRAGETVVFDNRAIASETIRANHVSNSDCFHPSVAGQNLISTTTWNVVQSRIENLLRSP